MEQTEAYNCERGRRAMAWYDSVVPHLDAIIDAIEGDLRVGVQAVELRHLYGLNNRQIAERLYYEERHLQRVLNEGYATLGASLDAGLWDTAD